MVGLWTITSTSLCFSWPAVLYCNIFLAVNQASLFMGRRDTEMKQSCSSLHCCFWSGSNHLQVLSVFLLRHLLDGVIEGSYLMRVCWPRELIEQWAASEQLADTSFYINDADPQNLQTHTQTVMLACTNTPLDLVNNGNYLKIVFVFLKVLKHVWSGKRFRKAMQMR